MVARVSMGKNGRLTLPAELCRALDLHPGDELSVRVEDGRLMIEKIEEIEKRLLSWFASVPSDVSLVDELIGERREEARREAED